MLLKPREAGPYVFCRQCVMLAAKSEKFWCATEKSTNWTDKHVCFQSYQGLVLCLLIQLSKHVGELIESGWNCAIAALLWRCPVFSLKKIWTEFELEKFQKNFTNYHSSTMTNL